MKNKKSTNPPKLGNGKTRSVGVRLDEHSAAHLDYLCKRYSTTPSNMLRLLLSYIDDHETPCGRLMQFDDHLARMEQMRKKYGWI